MYEESKFKRAKIQDMTRKRLRQPKMADKKTLDRFKTVPYQLEYQRKYGGKRDESGNQSERHERLG